ncbi:MAG: hypothetical protein K0Q49_526 [Haloplasmataceae bacterium]|jgi:hypothetical protein|nr:hypothetical protein [Haloplasmataceae bacterium]
MNFFIFSFSYISKKKISELKNSFNVNELSDKYILGFLTKKNINNYFKNNSFSSLKNILSGKYLVLVFRSKDSVYLKSMFDDLNKFKAIINLLEIDLNLFLINYNNLYLFPDFIKYSDKYNNDYIYKNLLNIYLNNAHIYIKRSIHSYVFLFYRINNLSKLNSSSEYISYML